MKKLFVITAFAENNPSSQTANSQSASNALTRAAADRTRGNAGGTRQRQRGNA